MHCKAAVAQGNINSRVFQRRLSLRGYKSQSFPTYINKLSKNCRAKIRPSLPGSAVDSMLGRLCRGLRDGPWQRQRNQACMRCVHSLQQRLRLCTRTPAFSKTHKLENHSSRWEDATKDAANISREVLWGPEIPAAKHILTKLTGR